MQYKIGKIAKSWGDTRGRSGTMNDWGLIVPFKDPETNYRYYTSEQIDQLLYIQRFSYGNFAIQYT